MIDRPLLAERLKAAYNYLRSQGVLHTVSEFAAALGKSQGDISSALAAKGRVMTTGLLKRVGETFPEYFNMKWLLTGEGKMEAIDKSLKPHYPATVSAGILTGAIDAVKESDVTYEQPISRFPQYDYTIDVDGHSMEPTYSDKGMVACRRLYDHDEIKLGHAYIIATRDGAVLKRIVSKTLSSIRVISDNPEYKPYSIDTDSILAIDEVVGSVNVENPERSYKNYITDAMLKVYYDRLRKGMEDQAKFEEEMKDIIRNLASGIYSDNK